jgi:hypothetical protein
MTGIIELYSKTAKAQNLPMISAAGIEWIQIVSPVHNIQVPCEIQSLEKGYRSRTRDPPASASAPRGSGQLFLTGGARAARGEPGQPVLPEASRGPTPAWGSHQSVACRH